MRERLIGDFAKVGECATGVIVVLLLLECPNFNCNPVEPPPSEGCPRTIDLVFILDSSGSVQWWNWPKV